MRKVLFISHDATRTGAPIILLNLLKWLKRETRIPFEIILRYGGELKGEFEALAPVTVWHQGLPGLVEFAQRQLESRRIQLPANRGRIMDINDRLRGESIGLIYSNTVTNGEVMEGLSDLGVPMVTHVHELEYWIKNRVGRRGFERVNRCTDRFIAVSHAVKNNLVENHQISAERVDLIHGFVPLPTGLGSIDKGVTTQIRKEIGIPDGTLVVGGCGTLDWRKAPDLFLRLAAEVRRHLPETPVHFVWLGGREQSLAAHRLRLRAASLGVSGCVTFIGSRPNPQDYFSMFDVFALVSREDPFPLVMLEAAALGKPVLAFKEAGGASEFIENDCGYAVRRLDVSAMGAKLVMLLTQPNVRRKMGSRAAEKVAQRYTVQAAAPKLLEVISKYLQNDGE